MDINGAELITRHLEREGIAHVVGAHTSAGSNALLPLYRALADSKLIHVLARHEQGAGFIAQGIARRSGRAGVCMVNAGAGVTQLLPVLADANADAVPLVAICAQLPTAGGDAAHGVRTGHLVDSISKAHFEIRGIDDLLDVLPEAFRIAESDRKGPVLIDVPQSVLTERIRLPVLPMPAAREVPEAADAALFNQAAAMIDAARRPLLLLGDGVAQSQAQAAAVSLLEHAHLPTLMTLLALGTLPERHPLSLGLHGAQGARASQKLVEDCDLLIAVGYRHDDRATSTARRLAPNARRIHIELDARELAALAAPDLGIVADAGVAFAALAERVRPALRGRWHAQIRALQQQLAEPETDYDDLRQHPALIRATAAALGAETTVVADAGEPQTWVAQHYPFMRAQRWQTSAKLGASGFGLAAAMGAALASSDSRAVLFCSESSLLINMQELSTLVDLQLDVKIVVLDSSALGLLRRPQDVLLQRRYIGSLYERPPSLCGIAESFGLPALDLGLTDKALPRLREALRQPGPLLIRAPIVRPEQAPPLLMQRKADLETVH
ncbi:MAG: thiamine pyrophosphate-binding protein [Pseudomonadota bacterium]|nr:thiamine pyrophosphate-binding protein [Pseudomonadota bacterium]